MNNTNDNVSTKVRHYRSKTSILTGCLLIGAVFAALCPMSALAEKGKIAVTKGQKIAFLGDSITAAGARPGGYCRLVIDGLKRQGIEATPVFAGISGHKSNQMLARLEKDVLKHKPDWMTLSCGVNDVWHGARGVALEPYKKNITEIVTRAQAAGVKVMLLTSTMIGEDQPNSRNQKLLPYNAFLRKLAKEKNCLLADLNTDMQEALKKFPKDVKGNKLTGDGVHMNGLGNMMMAKGLLKAFGLSESQLIAAEKEWKNIPNTSRIRLQLGMSMAEAEKLNAIAAKAKKSLSQLFTEFLNEKKAEMLKE
ncbi:MAG: SGNH/GDSL hydrolase family protein [Phycisphaerae bacterium]|jgi:lysophospholipase L1-like esterase|nr:SGNH/GDSL hydrolase family protein [Phycisphaerae bacterium]